MNDYISSAIIFIVKFFVDVYLFVLFLRLLLQKYRAPFYNPICQMVIRATDPLVKPLRPFIPGFYGYDLAIVFWLLLLQILTTFSIMWLKLGILPHWYGVLLVVIGELGDKWINIIFFAILITVLLSWIPALQSSPMASIASILANPLLDLGRRFIPPIAGMDFSPLVILFGMKLISVFVCYPLINFGVRLAFT